MRLFIAEKPELARAIVEGLGGGCKECGKPLMRRASTKKKGSFWWGCSGYPNCKVTYFDRLGKPDIR